MNEARAAERFTRVFAVPKPILGMLHLKGDDRADVVSRAAREADILVENGIDGLVVEDYFGSVGDVEAVLELLASTPPGVPYGVNVLDDGPASFALADRYGAAFVQMDSVAGHLSGVDDVAFTAELARLREGSDVLLLGGVRFKYQPVLSGNPVEVDLRAALARCDAVVVTGAGTGVETSPERVRQFRDTLGPVFPVVVGAGLTAANCSETLAIADAAIVGSSLKDTLRADGDVSGRRVLELMAAVRDLRPSLGAVAKPGSVPV
jgi:predicted TIM-barrel enzyme